MKYLLVALNASYSHTNSAVRSLKYFCLERNPKLDIDFGEWTINEPVGQIYKGIYSYSPDVILFSTYIWNGELIKKIIPDLKKLFPECIIGMGGPEPGYFPQGYLKALPALDFIMAGEGEQTMLNLAQTLGSCFSAPMPDKKELCTTLSTIPNLYYKNEDGKICFTGRQELLCSLDLLPFPYPEITDPDNRIYYYETNRGCPFSCSYCMSSLDKKVRFSSLEKVYADLQRFLDAKVKLVKFVDRTFNLNEERYLKIWEYIVNHHNGKTMFHFEIEAEYLSENAIAFLQSIPAGVMQFEIGVQTSNQETLREINRSDRLEKLSENVKKLPATIKKHLDLIAGLPKEDLHSFGKSFDFVMNLKPDELQLGFLKVLHGTQMEEYALKNGWKWMENPPYEVFSTPYLSYKDILFLKDLEVICDAFYNSHNFPAAAAFIGRNSSWWAFFSYLTEQGRKLNAFDAARRPAWWFEFFAGLLQNNKNEINRLCGLENAADILYQLLRYDFVKSGKKGNFPSWYKHMYSKEEHRKLLEQNGGVTNARLDFAWSEYEEFSCNVLSTEPEKEPGNFKLLIKYSGRKA